MADSVGLIYIVSGKEYIREAAVSARSAKKQMPDISVAIVTNDQVNHACFDDVVILEDKVMRHDFGDHVLHIDKAPYDKAIKCDSDLYFDDSIEDIFKLLDHFDIAVAQAPLRHATDRVQIPEIKNIPDSFPEYQGGVVAFNHNDQFVDFKLRWEDAYNSVLEEGEISNQAALRAALYHSDCRIATLPPEYNCLFRMPGAVNGKVKAFHGRLIETGGRGAPKRADVEQAIQTINRREDLRAFYRSGRKVKLAEPNLAVEAIDSVRRNGIRYTLRRGYEIVRSSMNFVN